jgi:uncharacterized protein YfiM (DUF2279 family)
MAARWRFPGVSLALLGVLASLASATELRLFPESVPASHYLSPPGVQGEARFRLLEVVHPVPDGQSGGEGAGDHTVAASPTSQDPPATAPKLFTKSTIWATAIVLTGMSVWAALGVPKDHFNPWHVTNEKFFGKNTYAGGADKCSHFILSASFARELAWVYEKQGHSRDQSLALSLGVTVLSGVIQEIGDAFTPYGYSWEDIVADTLGTVTGVALTRYGLNDLIGLRVGFVPNDVPPPPNDCCVESLGDNYSVEIYSGDLKLAGLAKRLNANFGPARFLLVSATYDTKAYGWAPPRPDRQRNVGVDIGLNLPEILSAAGVPATTWWGTFLYKALNIIRIPYTAFGWHYNLNNHKWHGPDTGQKFD